MTTARHSVGEDRGSLGHLVIRAPNWVGDLVMATPVLEAAATDPRFERVSIVLRAHLREVLADGPLEPLLVPLASRRSEIGELRSLAADRVLLLSNSWAAAWRSLRAGIPERAGAVLGGRGLLLTHRVVPPTREGRRAPIPTAHLLRDVAGLFGIQVPGLRPRLHVAPETVARAREALLRRGLAPSEPYVLCSPSAAFGAAKLWPPEHFAMALDGLFERHGLRPCVTGGPGEEAQIEAVVRRCRAPVVSLLEEERNLSLLKAWVQGARLVLVPDSGPRWVAAAFGVRCVTVMGPNFPELTGSSLELCEVVRLEGLECSPCMERRCPLGHHRCMRELEPRAVLAAAERLFDGERSAS